MNLRTILFNSGFVTITEGDFNITIRYSSHYVSGIFAVVIYLRLLCHFSYDQDLAAEKHRHYQQVRSLYFQNVKSGIINSI